MGRAIGVWFSGFLGFLGGVPRRSIFRGLFPKSESSHHLLSMFFLTIPFCALGKRRALRSFEEGTYGRNGGSFFSAFFALDMGKGRDFAAFLRLLLDLGFGFGYSVWIRIRIRSFCMYKGPGWINLPHWTNKGIPNFWSLNETAHALLVYNFTSFENWSKLSFQWEKKTLTWSTNYVVSRQGLF